MIILKIYSVIFVSLMCLMLFHSLVLKDKKSDFFALCMLVPILVYLIMR